jgi:murein DD-endopeptidase MepM/ murein hydrolase activator NlpD
MRRSWVSLLALFTVMALLLSTPGIAAQSADGAEAESSELPIAEEFSPPLGFRDGVSYGPLVTRVDGKLVQNTTYGVKNPELQKITCFGIQWNEIYHAGVDLYRMDAQTTQGAEVTAVADGQVVYANPLTNYPGLVIIVEHRLPPDDGPERIYSVYSHIDDTSLAVVEGQMVSRGDRLGAVLRMRYTGRYPQYNPSGEDDSHLHFEMRYFLDGSAIYEDYAACNGIAPGRGYTYPLHPDLFPGEGYGYTDPISFIAERSPAGSNWPIATPTVVPCMGPTFWDMIGLPQGESPFD